MKLKFLKTENLCATLKSKRCGRVFKTKIALGCSFATLTLSSCANDGNYSELLTSSCHATPVNVSTAFSPKMPAAMDIYLDTSVSSTRYGRGVIDTPYRDLIALMLETSRDETTHSIYGFANKIAPVNRQTYLNAAKGETGVCAACGQSETRLDDLLKTISANPASSTAVVITDLWLDNKDLIESRLLTLGNPIRDLMTQGKSIGVLGVKAPYRHEVYDIPSGQGTKVLPAGRIAERPFFVLIIGNLEEVSGFYQYIESDLLSSLDVGSFKFNIFSPQTPSTLDGLAAFFVKAPDGLLDNGGFEFDGMAIPNFRVDTRKSNRLYDRVVIDNAAPEFAGLVAPLRSAESLSFLPAPSKYGFKSQAYSLEAKWEEACAPKPERIDWLEVDLDDLMSIQLVDGLPHFGLNFSNETAALLPANKTYWLDVDIFAAEVPSNDGHAIWMEEWGFRPVEGEALYASPPEFFPTLNLEAFRNLLNRAAAENFEPTQTISNINIILVTE